MTPNEQQVPQDAAVTDPTKTSEPMRSAGELAQDEAAATADPSPEALAAAEDDRKASDAPPPVAPTTDEAKGALEPKGDSLGATIRRLAETIPENHPKLSVRQGRNALLAAAQSFDNADQEA